jgi:hypothetical protein
VEGESKTAADLDRGRLEDPNRLERQITHPGGSLPPCAANG